MANDINAVIKSRGAIYGSFKDQATVTQDLEYLCYAHYTRIHKESSSVLSPVQKEGLHMILHKIGRIVNGDPDYVDSWLDIAGYATLVADYLTELKKGIEERQLSGNIPQMPTSRIVYADTEF